MNLRDLFNTSRPLAALVLAGLLGTVVQTVIILKSMGGNVAWSISEQKETIEQREAQQIEQIEARKRDQLAYIQQQHAERARLMQERQAQQLQELPE